ncbi:MAG TPA: hypothetical protein VMH33_04495 [Solirubrobacterales bacterium]|nr:hypothetical protein [Solirubrobacterales bacterium]
MRPKFLVLALPVFLALVLVAAGCGASNDESTTTAHKAKVEETPKLSKAEFISQGDAICGEVNTAIGSVSESAAESSSQTTQVANLYVGMVQSLQRLGQPTETAGFSEFWGAAEQLAKVEGEVKEASEVEDPVALEEASQEAVPALEEFQSQAAVYGFEDCSEGPHAPEAAPESSAGSTELEESGGVEAAPEEEIAPEEEFVPEEEVAPEEIAPETGGAGGEIEEVAPEEEAPTTGGESGGIGPG